MTPAQQATVELHAAFWGKTPVLASADTLATLTTLPARRHELMTGEVKELKALGMARLGKEKAP